MQSETLYYQKTPHPTLKNPTTSFLSDYMQHRQRDNTEKRLDLSTSILLNTVKKQ